MMELDTGRWLRPWLWLSPQQAHDLSQKVFPYFSYVTPAVQISWRQKEWHGLLFSNPLGIAGGVDKTGLCLNSWQHVGCGFLEVGTVTPLPQGPNPGRIVDRDWKAQALWNKMGFPNVGLDVLENHLRQFKSKKKVPLLINVGKNRATSNELAHRDYVAGILQLQDYGDAFVVNVSSPNTQGLRDLLTPAYLKNFLENIRQGLSSLNKPKPLLLKLSPDMEEEALHQALEVSLPLVEGWVLTNTTRQRAQGLQFPMNEGGVSGRPLCALSRKALQVAALYKQKDANKLIISVGGIDSADEVLWRLKAGADLVQIYSALIFHGPGFFKKTLRALNKAQVS